MDLVWSGSRQALALLADSDREIWGILRLSLQVFRPAPCSRSRDFPGVVSW